MEARFSRTEVEKLVRRTLPHTRVARWEGKDLILEIDEYELDKENIRGLEVWTHGGKVKVKEVGYCVCTTEKNGKHTHFVVMQ